MSRPSRNCRRPFPSSTPRGTCFRHPSATSVRTGRRPRAARPGTSEIAARRCRAGCRTGMPSSIRAGFRPELRVSSPCAPRATSSPTWPHLLGPCTSGTVVHPAGTPCKRRSTQNVQISAVFIGQTPAGAVRRQKTTVCSRFRRPHTAPDPPTLGARPPPRLRNPNRPRSERRQEGEGPPGQAPRRPPRAEHGDRGGPGRGRRRIRPPGGWRRRRRSRVKAQRELAAGWVEGDEGSDPGDGDGDGDTPLDAAGAGSGAARAQRWRGRWAGPAVTWERRRRRARAHGISGAAAAPEPVHGAG